MKVSNQVRPVLFAQYLLVFQYVGGVLVYFDIPTACFGVSNMVRSGETQGS